MQHLLILFCFISLGINLKAQQQYFFWDTLNGSSSINVELLMYENGSIYASAQNIAGSAINDYVILKCDTNGGNRKLNTYAIPRYNGLVRDVFHWNNKLITLGNGRDSGAVSTHFTYINEQTLAIDSTWVYADTNNSDSLFKLGSNKAVPLNNGHLIIIGAQYDYYNAGLMIELDEHRNIVWKHFVKLQTGYDYVLTDFDTLSNGHFVISGYSYDGNGFITTRQFFIIMDSNHNIINEVVWNGSGFSLGAVAVDHEDYIYLGGSVIDSTHTGEEFTHPKIAKYDTLGNQIWVKEYDIDFYQSGYYVDLIEFTNDSNVLFKCTYGSNIGLQGSLNKINTEGDSLWFKYVNYPEYPNYTSIWDFIELENGDLVIGGEYDNEVLMGFIAKLNQYGCSDGTDDCYDTPMLGTYNSIAEITQPQITAYPNPAKEVLYFKNLEIQEKLTLRFYSLTGVLVKQQVLTSSSVNISAMQAGVYVVTLQSNKELLGRWRLIKE